MPLLALQMKANLVGVTNLEPEEWAGHRWYLKVKCSACNEVTDKWQYATIQESHELTKGKGTCHILMKCSLCGRTNSLEILPDSYAPYSSAERKNEQFQTLVKFDCRGLEPVDFEPRVGWKCVGTDSGTPFTDINLHDKEWADYDERAAEAVEISEIASRFIHAKKD